MNRGNVSNLKCGNTKKSLSVLSSKEVCVLKFSQCELNMKAVLRHVQYLRIQSKARMKKSLCSWCSSLRMEHCSSVTDIEVLSLALLQQVKRIPLSFRQICKTQRESRTQGFPSTSTLYNHAHCLFTFWGRRLALTCLCLRVGGLGYQHHRPHRGGLQGSWFAQMPLTAQKQELGWKLSKPRCS